MTINIDEIRGYTFSFVFPGRFTAIPRLSSTAIAEFIPVRVKRETRGREREREGERRSRTARQSDGRTETKENRA